MKIREAGVAGGRGSSKVLREGVSKGQTIRGLSAKMRN